MVETSTPESDCPRSSRKNPLCPEELPSALAIKRLKVDPWKQDLVGVQIRKRFSLSNWYDGVIVSVEECVEVAYGNNKQTERIPIDEALELWVVAHQITKLPSFICSRATPTSLFQRRGESSSKPYSLSQFMELLQYTEHSYGGATIEVLEGSKLVETKTKASATEVYGRILPCATNKIFKQFMNLQPKDLFLDIGHGIGNTCLQAAYTVGCNTRGIESDKTRNAVSQILALRLEDGASIHKERDDMEFTPGSIDYRHGDLQDYHQRDFLTKDVTRVFFNNFNGVFSGERGNSGNLERNVAAWFAAAPEGTILVTISPLRSTLGCLPLKEAITARHRLGLPVPQATDASYYEVEEFDLGPINDVFSFSAGQVYSGLQPQVTCFLYLRCHQRTKEASFLCNNPDCLKAQNANPIEAVHCEKITRNGRSEKAAVVGACECRVSDRVLRTRWS